MPRLRTPAPYTTIDGCRCCGSANLQEVVGFGEMPIADRLVRPEDDAPEFVAPLTLAICNLCGLCQILETVDPEVLFGRDYPYYSSVSPALVRHFAASARHLIDAQRLTSSSRVVEAASNDGYMLETFARAGIPVLGIDPAEGPAREARKKGIDTVNDFFGDRLARDLVTKGIRADVFLANNVLAHVADTNGFVSGIGRVLADDGIAVLEFPYVLDLVRGLAFDTIYHQHLLYLTATTTAALFERIGLFLNDAERISVHGGSLRVTVSKKPGQTPRLMDLLAEETRLGVNTAEFFSDFSRKIHQLRGAVRKAIAALRSEGNSVAGYGAAAKATTLLGFFDLTSDDIRYIADKSTWKHGLAMPVSGIPIVPPQKLKSEPTDVVIILAWNFAREIISENEDYVRAGGRFLVPVPELREVSLENAGLSL